MFIPVYVVAALILGATIGAWRAKRKGGKGLDMLQYAVAHAIPLMILALFLTMSEIVVELYARTEHANGLYYLMFGLHGLTALVPWFWSSLVFMLVAFAMFLTPSVRNNYKLLPIACVLAFVGIWIEKGMGLIVPGFIPSPIGEVTEYYPTFIEVIMSLGNWAIGFLILTVLLKGAIGILLGEVKAS